MPPQSKKIFLCVRKECPQPIVPELDVKYHLKNFKHDLNDLIDSDDFA